MNPYKRNDFVLFMGESYQVKSTDGIDVLIENELMRLRVSYMSVQPDPYVEDED
jgi:hypothetical protein